MASFVAVYDACVLYPAPLRDLLLHLALTDLVRARWTERIHDEWIGALLADRADITAAQLARTRSLMDIAIPDAVVTGYEGLIDQLTLPGPRRPPCPDRRDSHLESIAYTCQRHHS